MKKIVAIFFISLVFGSCNFLIDKGIFYVIGHHTLYDGDFPEMNTFEDVAQYISSKLTYVHDGLAAVGPEETLTRGYGDCDEYVLAFMNVAHFTLGVDFGIAIVNSSNSLQQSIGAGGVYFDHAVVILNGQLYSAYHGTPITEYSAAYYYSFDEIFN